MHNRSKSFSSALILSEKNYSSKIKQNNLQF